MLYTPYKYRACIRALGRSRKKTPKRAAAVLLLSAMLFCVCLAFQENHASLIGSSERIRSFEEKQPALEPIEPGPYKEQHDEPRAHLLTSHPGARGIWDQDFEFSLEKTTVKVSAGDTLFKMLRNAGLAYQEAHQLIEAIRLVFDPAKLQQDQQICLGFVPGPGGQQMLQVFSLELDTHREVQVMRGNDHRFAARIAERNLKTRPVRFYGEIRSSMYQAALDQGMPVAVLMKLMNIYSYDIDFQRDIRVGDKIEVLYEEKVTPGGKLVEAGDILYASLDTGGRSLRIYRHETKDGIEQFFDGQGNSVRKALMVTPIDGAVISSGYGMRKHPIQGYNKMHRGLDFAAPTGTPVMAAGDGIITYAGRRGSYGNFVHIRHANQYETAYAHLSGYADGVKAGARVKQGEAIGYVGSTGRSTGPHLHYEIRFAGQSINPSTLKAPPGNRLDDEEMKRFIATKGRLENLYASLADSPRLVRVDLAAGKSGKAARN